MFACLIYPASQNDETISHKFAITSIRNVIEYGCLQHLFKAFNISLLLTWIFLFLLVSIIQSEGITSIHIAIFVIIIIVIVSIIIIITSIIITR